MARTSTLALTGLAAFAAYMWYKARAVGSLIFFPGPISSFNFVGSTPVLTFNIQVQNTSALPISVDYLAGNLFANGDLVANVGGASGFVVPAHGSAYVQLQAQFLLIGVVSTIINNIQQGISSVTLDFKGSAGAGVVVAPLDIPFKIGA